MAHLRMMTPPPAKVVMLMEDENDIACLVAHHLESSGFRIPRPAPPYSLISNAEEDRPALFILDLMLPEVSGFQLAAA
jgi:DNA-binding response OmpR family regulator